MLGGSAGSVGGSWVSSGREGRRSGLGTVGVGLGGALLAECAAVHAR